MFTTKFGQIWLQSWIARALGLVLSVHMSTALKCLLRWSCIHAYVWSERQGLFLTDGYYEAAYQINHRSRQRILPKSLMRALQLQLKLPKRSCPIWTYLQPSWESGKFGARRVNWTDPKPTDHSEDGEHVQQQHYLQQQHIHCNQ